MDELKQVRIDLGIIRSRLALAEQKEREFYALLKDAILARQEVSKKHKALLIREAELLGKVERVTNTKIKVRLEKKVDDVLTASLKSLTKAEKDQLLADLLATIPHS
jgi:hypothetical protein